MHPIRRLIAAGAPVLVLLACGSADRQLELRVDPVEDVEQLESIDELRLRVFTVADVEEPYATASTAAGATIEGISCEAIRLLNPAATDCVETTRQLLRDRELVHEGLVPPDGSVVIDAPTERLRVRVDRPGAEIAISPSGRVCTWTAAELVDDTTLDATIPVTPRC